MPMMLMLFGVLHVAPIGLRRWVKASQTVITVRGVQAMSHEIICMKHVKIENTDFPSVSSVTSVVKLPILLLTASPSLVVQNSSGNKTSWTN
jgi:hypothetical protein